MGGGSDGSSSSSESTATSTQSKKDTSKITKANYDKITLSESDGTTKDEVNKLFVTKPNFTSMQEVGGVQAEVVHWNGGLLGKTVTVGFSNGHAISKGITGMDGAKKITLDQFNQIQNGMNEDDVKTKLGNPTSENISSIMGQTMNIWTFNGSDLGSSATVTFTNGTVSGQSQAGLK